MIGKFFTEPFRVTKRIRRMVENILSVFPGFAYFKKTRTYEYPITLSVWFWQKCLGYNGSAYWPMHPSSLVTYPQRILVGKGVNPGYQPGCSIHGVNKIYIGDYTFIAPNVGIQSGNHDVYDLRMQTEENEIRIGKYCWLGMGAVILPGVKLGDFTIVGAGSIVTRSFEKGHCVIAGVPAKKIRDLDKEKCIRYEMDIEYIGYIRQADFKQFTKEKLLVCAE
jgi:acetyltransferase-like isoleucine patch superfamily enzyme